MNWNILFVPGELAIAQEQALVIGRKSCYLFLMHSSDTYGFRHCPSCCRTNLSLSREYRILCPDCGFCYHINAAACVVALIRDPEGRILFSVRAKEPKQGMLDLPGGFVDPAESAEAALRREIREELNLSVSDIRYLFSVPVLYEYKNVTYHNLDLCFACSVDDFSTLSASDEIADILFLKTEEVDRERVGFASDLALLEYLEKS